MTRFKVVVLLSAEAGSRQEGGDDGKMESGG